MDHLDSLEDRSVHLFREAYANFKSLCMLWSIGKDSTVLLWLARKAFFGHVPFPLVHIDTSFKIAIDVLKDAQKVIFEQRGVRRTVRCFFSETDPESESRSVPPCDDRSFRSAPAQNAGPRWVSTMARAPAASAVSSAWCSSASN